MLIDGVPREIVIDDRFPYDSHKEHWAFSRTEEKEIWVQLLEKAWAKVYGSYQRIEAGTIGEAFPALTGAPTTIFNHEEFEYEPYELWSKIQEADIRGYLMTTAVASGDEAKYDANGN